MREGWVEKTLGAAIRVDRVSVPPSRMPEMVEPYSIPGLDAGRVPELVARGDVGSNKFMVSERAVLVSMLNPRIPRTVVAEPGTYCSTEFAVLVPNLKILSVEYLAVLVTGRTFQERLTSVAKGTTGSRSRSKASDVQEIPTALPPLDEQRRIVDLIGTIDDAIEACEDAHASILQIMDRFPAAVTERVTHDGSPITTLGVLLGSPGAVRTGPFGSQLHQSDYVADGPASVVMPADMQHGRVNVLSAARIRQEDADRLQRHRTIVGDILWSRRGDVTRFAVIDEDSEGVICGTGCFLLRPTMPVDASWLEVLLSAPSVRTWLVSNAVGATMANLNRTILSSIPVPELREEKRAEVVEAWSAIRGAERQQRLMAEALRALRTNALSNLLSGEHEIPESYDELVEEVA